MATKAELLEKARKAGLDVNTKTSKADLESKLANTEGNTDSVDKDVTVNENQNGEATRGTTKDGDESPVQNGESVPQNGLTSVEVHDQDADTLATKPDDSGRTEEEFKFADESNPNNKARVEGAGGSDFDQDGRPRTGGKSYGVAANNPENKNVDFSANAGEAPARHEDATFLNPEVGSDDDTNNQEWSDEDIKSLEDSLSEPDNGIFARVSTSVGKYVRVKFFRNNLAFGTYKSRDFNEADAKQYLADLKESAGL